MYLFKLQFSLNIFPGVGLLDQMVALGPPPWLSGKETTCSVEDRGDMGSVPGSGRSLGGGNGNPLWYSCLGKSHGHGHRSLVGYSPKGHKELDTTERLSMRAHAHTQYLCFSFFREPPYSFLWRLCQFTFPPAVEEGSFFSMPSVDPFFIRSFI